MRSPSQASAATMGSMFFFSNRVGCLGSLLLSVVVTVILLFVLNVI